MAIVTARINNVEQKTSKNGKEFLRVQVGQEWMTYWGDKTKVYPQVGQLCKVSYEQKGDFRNVSNVERAEDGAIEEEVPQIEKSSQNANKSDTSIKQSMMLSYSKDVFIALSMNGDSTTYEDLAKEAVKIVKTMRDALG